MNQTEFDVVIIGAGAMGSAAAYHLSRAKQRVLLLEQFEIAHTRGSSHGESRIFRFAYTNADYAKFAMQCKPLWRALEQDAGVKLLTETGGIDLGTDDIGMQNVNEVEQALQAVGATYERINFTALKNKFPQWNMPQHVQAVYSPDAGVLNATLCVQTQVARAAYYGAQIHANEKCLTISPISGGVEVVTDRARYRAKKGIVSAGAWANQLLAQINCALPLKIEKEQVVYFAPRANAPSFATGRFPVWIHYGATNYYGFPMLGAAGVKMGIHHDKEFIKIEDYDRQPSVEVTQRLRAYMSQHLPDAAGRDFDAIACLYTVTPDEDFVIDFAPTTRDVLIASPCSGHGFKFAIGVGKALSDLALHGTTDMRIGHCGVGRLI